MKTASTEAVRSWWRQDGGLHPAGHGVPRLVAGRQHDRGAQAGRSAGAAGHRVGVAAWQRAAELVTPFATIARENGSKHAAGLKHSI
ncbi:hypothetical protein M8494_01830 [Serratia ureilytica]